MPAGQKAYPASGLSLRHFAGVLRFRSLSDEGRSHGGATLEQGLSAKGFELQTRLSLHPGLHLWCGFNSRRHCGLDSLQVTQGIVCHSEIDRMKNELALPTSSMSKPLPSLSWFMPHRAYCVQRFP